MSDREQRGWESGWEGHERAQRDRLARLTLIEKLQWLEEAQRLVAHLARRRENPRPDSDPDAGSKERGSAT